MYQQPQASASSSSHTANNNNMYDYGNSYEYNSWDSNGASSTSDHRTNPGPGLSLSLPVEHSYPADINALPTSVRALLTSTQTLSHQLALWSVGDASEEQVSDVYVDIGTRFNEVIVAFAAWGVDLADMHPLTTTLRTILESLLAESPSPATLALFMPDVRNVFIALLKGLKEKRPIWRAKAEAAMRGE